MILFVEILCCLLFVIGVLKTIPSQKSFDVAAFFHRALIAFGAPVQMNNHCDEDPAPLCTWDDLDETVLWSGIQRRCNHLLLLDYDVEIGPALAKKMHLRHHKGVWSIEALAALPEKSSDRFLILVEGTNAQSFLNLMKENPGLRDYVAALIAIDPQWDEAWMSQYFNHEDLDAEVHYAIPYVQLRLATGPPMPQPSKSTTGWKSIHAIDLGVFEGSEFQSALMPALALLTGKLTA